MFITERNKNMTDNLKLVIQRIRKMKKRRRAAWFLVVGTRQSGKTSFLKTIDSNLADPMSNAISENHSQQDINCWLNKETVFIEMNTDLDIQQSPLLYKVLKDIPWAAVLLLVDIPFLLNAKQNDITKFIHSINQSAPLYLIINKFDHFPGFQAFVGEAGKEEREQLCGFELSSPATDQQVAEKFQQWLTQLHQQQLWRLQQETQIDKRPLIKDFVIELQQIKQPLIHTLHQLQSNAKLTVQGAYFISSSSHTDTKLNKPFFIKQLQHLLTLHTRERLTQQRNKQRRLTVIASCFLFVSVVSCFWFTSYQLQHQKIVHLQTLLNQSQHSQNAIDSVIETKQLQTLLKQLKQKPSWYHRFGFTQYQQLQHHLLPNNASQIDAALTALRQQLIGLYNNPALAFHDAKQRMQTAQQPNDAIQAMKIIAAQSPQPWRKWLMQAADNSQQSIFLLAKQYINQRWQQLVLPDYQRTIANRYPIFANSTQQIRLKDFAAFFGPKGIFNTFFDTYLKPFIDTQHWQLRQRNHAKLPLSAKTLNVLIEADLIQKMFFQNNTNQIALTFQLKPLQLGGQTQAFRLKYGNNVFAFKQGEIEQFNWPVQTSDVEAIFMNKQKHFTVLKGIGPWAWFQLLDHAVVTQGKDLKHFNITLKINHNVAQYQLITDQSDNPFIPGVMSQFRCPKHLS